MLESPCPWAGFVYNGCSLDVYGVVMLSNHWKRFRMKEQLLTLAYDFEDGFSDRDFECLIALIEDGTIDTFEELARYGVKQ
jgi:hypothetical protein